MVLAPALATASKPKCLFALVAVLTLTSAQTTTQSTHGLYGLNLVSASKLTSSSYNVSRSGRFFPAASCFSSGASADRPANDNLRSLYANHKFLKYCYCITQKSNVAILHVASSHAAHTKIKTLGDTHHEKNYLRRVTLRPQHRP